MERNTRDSIRSVLKIRSHRLHAYSAMEFEKMNLALFFFCVSIIGSIHGSHRRHSFRENYGPHMGEVAECRGARMELNDQMMAVKCMPRMSLVKLRADPDSQFLPDMVSVNRCSGMCAGNLSCMPSNATMVPIMVKRKHIKSHAARCFRVFVEEHTDCKCKCNVMKEDCNRNQIYREDICACVCMNVDEQLACMETPGMIWNAAMCKCICAMPEEECSTGLEWIPSKCKCKRVMDDDV